MLEGIIRDSISKQATKALRRDGYLIANIYGKGVENVNAAFKSNEYIKFLKNKENTSFNVKVGDEELRVVVQAYQKHPVTSQLLHVDLLVATEGIEKNYYIPVKTTGIPKGLKNKGLLMIHKKRLKVKCAIENLPNEITLDVTNLDTGEHILLRDIELPSNVKCFAEGRIPLVGVIKAG